MQPLGSRHSIWVRVSLRRIFFFALVFAFIADFFADFFAFGFFFRPRLKDVIFCELSRRGRSNCLRISFATSSFTFGKRWLTAIATVSVSAV